MPQNVEVRFINSGLFQYFVIVFLVVSDIFPMLSAVDLLKILLVI